MYALRFYLLSRETGWITPGSVGAVPIPLSFYFFPVDFHFVIEYTESIRWG